MSDISAHNQAITHHYVMRYPDHSARQNDPNYVDFNHYHDANRATARCALGEQIGFDECMDEHGNPCPVPADGGEQPGLELHHAHIEFALQNSVDLTILEKDYPGVSDPTTLGAWVESGANLIWYCSGHHRGAGGVHNASSSDFEAEKYIHNLIISNKGNDNG